MALFGGRERLENLILNYVNGEKGKEFSNCELVMS
jgi:hypothetical protein